MKSILNIYTMLFVLGASLLSLNSIDSQAGSSATVVPGLIDDSCLSDLLDQGLDSLEFSVGSGDIAGVKEHLAAGANPLMRDSSGNTLLDYAEKNEEKFNEIYKMLVSATSAKIEPPNVEENEELPSELGLSNMALNPFELYAQERGEAQSEVDMSEKAKALLDAVNKNDVAEVRKLLATGADPNYPLKDATNTPLIRAAGEGWEEMVRLLLKAGAKPNAADSRGRTPLHWAVPHACKNIVAVLLQYGADPLKRSINGESPLSLAEEFEGDYSEIVVMLRSAVDDRSAQAVPIGSSSTLAKAAPPEVTEEERSTLPEPAPLSKPEYQSLSEYEYTHPKTHETLLIPSKEIDFYKKKYNQALSNLKTDFLNFLGSVNKIFQKKTSDETRYEEIVNLIKDSLISCKICEDSSWLYSKLQMLPDALKRLRVERAQAEQAGDEKRARQILEEEGKVAHLADELYFIRMPELMKDVNVQCQALCLDAEYYLSTVKNDPRKWTLTELRRGIKWLFSGSARERLLQGVPFTLAEIVPDEKKELLGKLQRAIQKEDLYTLSQLIREGADVNQQNENDVFEYTLLMNAVDVANPDMVQMLIDAGANTSTALSYAKDAVKWADRERAPRLRKIIRILEHAATKVRR